MKLRNSLLLLITATIWGTAFVAQSVGMDYVGPMTYVCARSIIGMIVLLPVIAVLNRVGPPRAAETPEERRKGRKTLVIGGVCCGTVLCIASCTQQLTLLHTTVGKAGFMTACYILVVPLIGLLFGRRCGLKHWCSVAIALAGLYFLCMTGGGFSLDLGTLLGLCCAFLFSCHILVIDYFSTRVDGVKMSCIQFFTCAVLAGIGMLLFEQPTWANILAAWKPILYAGAMSSGVAYTFQIIGQKGTASDDRKPYHESGIGYLGHLRLAAARSGAVGARDLRLRADVRRDRARAAAGKAQGAGVIIIIWFVNKAAFA